MSRFYILYFLLFVFSFLGKSQELLSPVASFPELKAMTNTKTLSIKSNQIPYVTLPFADDFSYDGLVPDPKKWANRSAYVNQRFGVAPVTIGVLTFDAVNDTGAVYSHAGQFAFVADTMASNYVRLDSVFGNNPAALSVVDSIYFSFWFQPQGLGNAPETDDSLTLQFYNPQSGQWNLVWAHEGLSLDSFRNRYGLDFVRVMIPVVNADYFSKNFRFRFINYASIPNNTIPSWKSGLYDHWHVDYVYIDKNRTYNEQSLDDIAFTTTVNSLLKNYISMPWNQYIADSVNEFESDASVKIRNFDMLTIKNINQYFYIQNLNDKSFHLAQTYPSSDNINGGAEVTFKPDYNYSFQSNASPYADFEVAFNLLSNTPPIDIIRSNDSMSFYQKFYNYYAYDDGNAEAGYGLSNQGARLAYKFELNTPDSLQAIQFYFNQTLGNANQVYFFLTVWNDNNGQPGTVIYEQSGIRPVFEDELFKFHTYPLNQALYLTGSFYVGWRQTSVDNLNVGFDLNNDKSDKIFYNSNGNWTSSQFDGALMIRPILGNQKEAYVGIETSISKSDVNVSVYPNPISPGQELHIEFKSEAETTYKNLRVQIFDFQGKLMLETDYSSTINISNLSCGMYIIRIQDERGDVNVNKKLIIR